MRFRVDASRLALGVSVGPLGDVNVDLRPLRSSTTEVHAGYDPGSRTVNVLCHFTF